MTEESNVSGPLICVCGCTGTGKSDLGVAIARRCNGEVVNADAMQIYNALDIANNKLTAEEMDGVPHHLLGHCPPTLDSYTVHRFRIDALRVIHDIWRRGKLPVVVGGTAYYLESVIYTENLIEGDPDEAEKVRERLRAEFPDASALYAELKRVDPEMALSVHPNNHYRVLRALEVFYLTGTPKSEHLAQQQKRLGGKTLGRLRFPRTFFFNLDAERDTLNERLDKRVNKMLERGLIQELDAFYKQYEEQLGAQGIMQTIGLKEFIPYLKLSEEERQNDDSKKLFEKCLEKMKTRTRQYAKKQRNWIYQRILLRGKIREIPEYVSLNTTRNFWEAVVPFALDCAQNFLEGRPALDSEAKERDEIRALLMPLPERPSAALLSDTDYTREASLFFHCSVCSVDVQSRHQWTVHCQSQKHRHFASKQQKEQKPSTEKEEEHDTEKCLENELKGGEKNDEESMSEQNKNKKKRKNPHNFQLGVLLSPPKREALESNTIEKEEGEVKREEVNPTEKVEGKDESEKQECAMKN